MKSPLNSSAPLRSHFSFRSLVRAFASSSSIWNFVLNFVFLYMLRSSRRFFVAATMAKFTPIDPVIAIVGATGTGKSQVGAFLKHLKHSKLWLTTVDS